LPKVVYLDLMAIEISGNGAEPRNVLGASILVIISTNNNIPFYIEFSIVILLSRTHLNTRVPPTSDIPLQHIRNGYLLPNDGMRVIVISLEMA